MEVKGLHLPARRLIALWAIVLPLLGYPVAHGQSFYRFEGDISMKSRVKGGEGSLTLGRVFYDRTHERLAYRITFPEREVWVLEDSISKVFRNDMLYSQTVVPPFVRTTIFHKILEGSMNDFGLRGSMYSIHRVEREGNMVVTTWHPPANHATLGKVLTSTIGNRLHGVVIYSPGGEILSRQVFSNYQVHAGLSVPTEIVQVMYREGVEVYQLITLSNIVINSTANEDMYNFSAGGR